MSDCFASLVSIALQNFTEDNVNKLYYGHVDTEEQFSSLLEDLRSRGFSYYTRSSNIIKSKRLLFSYDHKNADIKIPFTGSPFHVVKSMYMSCSQDDRYRPHHERTRGPLIDHPSCKKKRVSKQPTKKIGCPAFLSMKCIRVYDDKCYQLNLEGACHKSLVGEKKLQRTKILNVLEYDLMSSSPPTGSLRFMIVMSRAEVHIHTVVSSNLKQILHSQLIAEIHSFVKKSFCSVNTMKIHLKETVKKMFEDKNCELPDRLNRRYYPVDHVIRYHMHQALFNSNSSKFDQDDLEACVTTWREAYPQDNFFFRPYKAQSEDSEDPEMEPEEGAESSSTTLFCHQTSWQHDILNLNANNITLLDSSYNTCKYSLPMFFIIVKTENGYCVVGTFVVHLKSSELIREALEVFKLWNPDWSPKYFLADFSFVEIYALEQTFPDSTVYLCSSRREQLWNRWLTAGNVPKQVIVPLKKLWKLIASSETETDYHKNLQQMYSSNVYKSCNPAQSYFSKEWLPLHHKWVQAFQANEFLSEVNTNSGLESHNKVLKKKYLSTTKDRTLTHLLRIVIEHFLPDAMQKYSLGNLSVKPKYSSVVEPSVQNETSDSEASTGYETLQPNIESSFTTGEVVVVVVEDLSSTIDTKNILVSCREKLRTLIDYSHMEFDNLQSVVNFAENVDRLEKTVRSSVILQSVEGLLPDSARNSSISQYATAVKRKYFNLPRNTKPQTGSKKCAVRVCTKA